MAPVRYSVTSAHDLSRVYEVTVEPETYTCPVAQPGDPVCLHRAAVRVFLSQPDPEPAASSAYDPDAEVLQWAENDLARAPRSRPLHRQVGP